MDGFNGTAGNDTFTGLVNSSGTYTVGDNIIGGAGTDTLNLIAQSATDAAGALVSVAGVENVNVRLLTTAGAAFTMNAADWEGVAVLSNASSVDGTLLQVSGLETTTKVNLIGDTDINIGYNSTTTATSAVTIALTSAGNFGTGAHTLAGTGLATANIDLDLANAGLVTSVNVEINGDNAARIEAGSNVTTYTLSGAGSAVLVTDDTITSFNAAAMTGGVDVTFSGASDVAAVGGAGNDTFRFGTTISNNDTVNGGSGNDTVALTVAGFNRNLSTSNVESATVTFSEAAGGTLNASASTVTAFTLAAGTAGNAASISQIADASVFTINDDDLGNVTLDYVSGAATTTLNIGSGTGAVAVGTLTVTDVASVTVNSVGGSAGAAGSVASASFDSDAKSLAIISSGGEADMSFGDTVAIGGVSAVTVTSNGSAGISFSTGGFAGTALSSVALNANGAGAVTVGAVSGTALTSVSLNGADITLGALALGNVATASETSTMNLSLTQGATSTMAVGAITVTGQGTLNVGITQNSTGATATIGAITLSDTIATGDQTVNLSVGAVAVGDNGAVQIGQVTVTAAAATTAGAQITLGAVTIGANGYYGVSGIAVGSAGVLNVDVSDISVNAGSSADFNIGDITTNAGIVGSTQVTLATGASATFGVVAASAVGAYTLNLAGVSADLNMGNVSAAQRVGAIEIVGVDGASATFGTISASAVGAISVSGALDVVFGVIGGNTIGEVNAQGLGASGSFTIDLSSVSGAAEIKLGAATNTILSGDGRDVITLLAGRTGNDVIRYTTANTSGTDSIIGFFAGSTGLDQIEIAATGLGLVSQTAGAAITADAAVDLFLVTAGGTTSTMTGADNIILLGSAFATTAGMIAAVVDGGTQEIILNGTAVTGSTFTIVWTDGSDSYVSLLQVSGATGLSLTTGSVTTLAQLSGVTPGALVAANFDFV